jgi:hypothetical protein
MKPLSASLTVLATEIGRKYLGKHQRLEMSHHEW